MFVKVNVYRAFAAAAAAAAKSLQLCPTLCDPIDGSLQGSSIHGIFQARVLEWVAIAFSNTEPLEYRKYSLLIVTISINLLGNFC